MKLQANPKLERDRPEDRLEGGGGREEKKKKGGVAKEGRLKVKREDGELVRTAEKIGAAEEGTKAEGERVTGSSRGPEP